MVDCVDQEAGESDMTAGKERRWPVWLALLTAGFTPETTARRTDHVSLPKAFGVHLLSAVLVGFVICWMKAWVNGCAVSTMILQSAEDLVRRLTVFSGEYVFEVLLSVAVVEGVFPVAALVLCSWGARDELVGSSFRASLRRTWIQSSQAVYVALLIGVVVVPSFNAWRDWNSTWRLMLPDFPTAPVLPAADATSDELDAYNVEAAAYQKDMEVYWAENHRLQSQRPWYVTYRDEIWLAVVVVATVWWLLALLRSVGTRRDVEPLQRAPMCECCGYNLSGSAPDGVCPECGEGVEVSLGPLAQRRSTWEKRGELGVWYCWRESTFDAICRPMRLGRQLPVGRWSIDHRRFLLAHIAVVFVLTWVGVPLCYYGAEGHNPFVKDPEVVWTVGLASGLGLSVAFFFFALVAALGVGVWFSRRDGRNLLLAAVQAVSYLGGYLCLWVLFNCVAGPLVLAAFRWDLWLRWGGLTGVDEETLAFIVWLVPNVAIGGLFLRNVIRITSGARYANS